MIHFLQGLANDGILAGDFLFTADAHIVLSLRDLRNIQSVFRKAILAPDLQGLETHFLLLRKDSFWRVFATPSIKSPFAEKPRGDDLKFSTDSYCEPNSA